jgi:UDP-2-acetamido-3-amino-2,3-dideoxy-glucuronate N-acetyltransferase
MTATATMVQSRNSYMAHALALVESDAIGENTRIWAFAHVMKDARIGRDCNIGEHCYIEQGVTLGNNVTVKNGVNVWTGVTVEDNVFLGPNCVLTNDPNPRAYIKKSAGSLVETLIRANATIGANATIVCGVSIGRYAFIGAGAVVIRSVQDFALVVGNPALQIGWMCICAHRIPMLVGQEVLTCPHCRLGYRRGEDGLVPLPASCGTSIPGAAEFSSLHSVISTEPSVEVDNVQKV